MPSNCSNINPLVHSGTSQHGRVLKALSPSFAMPDERTGADLVLFAKEYGKYLHYFTNANEADGNWQALMRMDISVVLATISRHRINDFQLIVREEFAFISSDEHNNIGELKSHLSFLFDFVYSWFYELESQCRLLPDEWPYKSWLTDTIRSVLAERRYKIAIYYDKAKTANLISNQSLQPAKPVPFAIQEIEYLQTQYWQDCWEFTPDPMQPFNPVLHGPTDMAKIKNLAVNNLFTGLFDAVFKQAALIVSKAVDSLEDSFTGFPKHTPHYALYLAFIKLFRFAQNEINQFTKRHLDLYYKDILQLRPKPAEPDHAHLILSLQKNINQYLVPSGTLFKAGKDANGNELFYASEKDVVINTAQVAAIKSVLAVPKTSAGKNYQRVYAATVSNSADGKGEAFSGDDKSWSAFGPELTTNLSSLGFALASHMLYLQEGTRKVKLELETVADLSTDLSFSASALTIQLTGEKDWETATVTRFQKDAVNKRKFYIECSLDPKATAIVPFDAVLHKDVYNTKYPVMRILVKSTTGYNAWHAWSDTVLKKIKLSVEVTDLKKLMVKNDLSVLDTAKPFQPFGPSPYKGSTCIIGSKEIFQKENASVKLHFEWDKISQPEGIISGESLYLKGVDASSNGAAISGPIYDYRHTELSLTFEQLVVKATASQLRSGSWGPGSANQLLFSSREMFGDALVDHIPGCGDPNDLDTRGLYTSYPKPTISASASPVISFTVQEAIPPDFGPDEPYSNDSIGGFMRLQLNRDLGHKDFVQRFTQLASNQDKPPLEPYAPLAKTLKADYEASLTLDLTQSSASSFKNKKWQFFSVEPFGVKEDHLSLNNSSSFTITPPFDNEGELYIGLDKAVVNSTVSVLFQVSEGSADPLFTKQEVIWNYLSANNLWKPFEDGKVSDDTNGLLHSGIIAFALPNDMVDAPTVMGSNYKWIRAAVVQSTAAICRLIELKAQAIKTIWTDAFNTGVTYSQFTPAGTIAKLQVPQPVIKKVEQPYDSFGGRLPESSDQFYLRSSERLRHKKRAITIWDYERLVLEAFPEIYKVKCLNHTMVRINASGNEIGDNELAPGHVVVVPVPDISKMHSKNPLRPLTSLDTLTNIEEYLVNLTSGQVKLQVRNPVFEEVVIKCHVQFFGDDPAYYHGVLLDEIQQFMCPWAYNGQTDIEFGGKISKSILIDFIEERSYVDYLTKFRMYLRVNNVVSPIDREEITASRSRSILVNAPLNYHDIRYLNVQC